MMYTAEMMLSLMVGTINKTIRRILTVSMHYGYRCKGRIIDIKGLATINSHGQTHFSKKS